MTAISWPNKWTALKMIDCVSSKSTNGKCSHIFHDRWTHTLRAEKKKKKWWVYTERTIVRLNICFFNPFLWQNPWCSSALIERRVYYSLSCILFAFRIKCSFHQFHYENILTLFQWNYFILGDLSYFFKFFVKDIFMFPSQPFLSQL